MNMNAHTGFTTQETGDMKCGPNDDWCRLAWYVFYTFISLLTYTNFIASSTMNTNANARFTMQETREMGCGPNND